MRVRWVLLVRPATVARRYGGVCELVHTSGLIVVVKSGDMVGLRCPSSLAPPVTW